MKTNWAGYGLENRMTYRDFQHVPADWDQIKIGLFSTPNKSWVHENNMQADGEPLWKKKCFHAWVGIIRPYEQKQKAGKELVIWDSDWNGRSWKDTTTGLGRNAGQGSWVDYWKGTPLKTGGKRRRNANIVQVWAGGDGNDEESCLPLALEFMRKVAVGKVDLYGDLSNAGFKVVV